jgi:SOS-response transcriptional repressor LexA
VEVVVLSDTLDTVRINEVADKTIGDRLGGLIELRGVSYYWLEGQTGIAQEYIKKKIVENRKADPRQTTMKRLAKALNVDPAYFYTDNYPVNSEAPISQTSKTDDPLSPDERIGSIEKDLQRLKIDLKNQIAIPVMGVIPASYPCVVEESYEGDITIPRQLLEGVSVPEKVFAVRVQGESLIGDAVLPGDFLFISPMPDIDIEGRVYIVRVHNQCTAKHVYHANGRIRLVASNSDYEDLEPDQVEIVGRVVARYGTM